MSDGVSLSQEQADMLEVSVQPAISTLVDSGVLPTLYVHDGEQITCVILASAQHDELQDLARTVIGNHSPNVLAYALLYESNVETEDGPREALIIETGDEEDAEARELAKWYSPQTKQSSPGFSRLGSIANLLK